MTEEPMRTREEIVRAHDMLTGLIIDPDLRPRICPETLACIEYHVDVLCWILHHDHNQNFEMKLAILTETLRDLGFELVDTEPEEEAKPTE